MMVDLRRFEYALEPLRRQRQWKLDALLARLGRIQAQVHRTEKALAELRESHRAQSREALESLTRWHDPAHYARCLHWLAHLQREIVNAESHLAELKTQRSELRTRCRIQQQKVDVMDAHRSECVTEFCQQETGRLATEADRDWMSRTASAAGRIPRRSALLHRRSGTMRAPRRDP